LRNRAFGPVLKLSSSIHPTPVSEEFWQETPATNSLTTTCETATRKPKSFKACEEEVEFSKLSPNICQYYPKSGHTTRYG
jgi:hypothetical protein